MENEKMLIKADIKYMPSKVRLIVYYVLAIGAWLVGFATGNYGLYDVPGERLISRYGLRLDYYAKFIYYKWRVHVYKHPEEILIVIAALIVLVAIPLIIRAIMKRQCAITALTVTEKGIVGSYNSFISQVSVNTPVEHIDSMTITNTLGDKLRSGKTLNIRSNFGNIRLHYVHNAEEIVQVTMKHINELKSK